VAFDKMTGYRSAGINRLSLGIQSLLEEELVILHRQHTAREAIHAIHQCHAAGFKNISIGLMLELPSQPLDSWKKKLCQLQGLPIILLRVDKLLFEPHTIFYKKRAQLEPRLPSDQDKLSMFQSAVSHLEALGLKRYEISASAHEGFHSRHNTGYWLGRPFLGL